MSDLQNATTICREALVCFVDELQNSTTRKVKELLQLDIPDSPRLGVHYAHILVSDNDMARDIEHLSVNYITPCMTLFARKLRNLPLSSEYMELPKGYDSANERWHGVAMRVVVNATMPVGRRSDIPATTKRYYDIATDSWITGPCTNAILFTVCEKGEITKTPRLKLLHPKPNIPTRALRDHAEVA